MPARPKWRSIVSSDSFTKPKKNSKKILLATGTGSHWVMSGFESVLAAALKIRGAHVEVLLCDGVLPACQECDLRMLPSEQLLKNGAKSLCKTCFKPAKAMFSELNLPIIAYSDWILDQDLLEIEEVLLHTKDEEICNLHWRGIPVGEHAIAGTLRFFARGDLTTEPHGMAVARKYLHAALLTTAALQRLFKNQSYNTVVFHHGIYVPQGIVGDVCRQLNIGVVNWHPAYRSRTYLFCHGDTYHKTMIDEPCDQWENMNWDSKKEHTILKYLQSRSTGSEDWISFQRPDNFSYLGLQKLGLDNKKPIIGLLTNVIWDAQLHFRHNAFNSMLEWLFYTIEYFTLRLDLQLLIRIHPAEMLGGVPSRQKVENEINARFPKLSPNIYIIDSSSHLDTYSLMDLCNAVLVYGTKMAIELPCTGKPTIVAGESWARGKGFTTDVTSILEYKNVLDRLPTEKFIDDEMITKARRYAYHLFYRRMIPVKFAKKFPHLVPFSYDIPSLQVLAVGEDKGLDTICEGILTGKQFIYDEHP